MAEKGKEELRKVDFGTCVWTTGIKMAPITSQLINKLPSGKLSLVNQAYMTLAAMLQSCLDLGPGFSQPCFDLTASRRLGDRGGRNHCFAGAQEHWRSLMTDPYLCVKGSHGTIFALGDAATIEQVSPGSHRPPPGPSSRSALSPASASTARLPSLSRYASSFVPAHLVTASEAAPCSPDDHIYDLSLSFVHSVLPVVPPAKGSGLVWTVCLASSAERTLTQPFSSPKACASWMSWPFMPCQQACCYNRSPPP